LSRRARSSRFAAALLLLGAACRTAAPPSPAAVPDPLAPPLAGPPLTAAQQKAVRAAAGDAARGDVDRARRLAAKLPAGHPAGALVVLEARWVRGEDVAGDALALAASADGYGPAWELAAAALEKAGRDEEALAAGRRLAALRGDDASGRLAARLEAAVAERGAGEAAGLLGRGDAAAAFARALRTLELVPAADEVRVVAARAALASGQTQRAVELLPALPDTPAGLEVKGRVAEALGQWDLAEQLYERLPETFPGRCELLAGAREQARLALAPPYVARALAAPAVTRGGLAAILAWVVPELAEKASGPVPVFEDVVGLPEGRDIVVAVRAGVLSGDSIARRFGPRRAVTERELLACLGRLAAVAAAAPPVWCGPEAPAGDCLARPATLDGRTAAALVRAVAGSEVRPCIPR
jgi:tetratricopeptide (TPR) repeat protein